MCHQIYIFVINYSRGDMMASRMDEFRKFVSTHPLVRDDVKSGKKTWQNIYETKT